MCARFTVLSDTPIASAIACCVIPLSRSSTIWMRWRCSARPFHRSAVFNRRTWPLEHLTICSRRIRWTKRITSRDPKTIHIPIFGPTPPQTFRFNQLWKWYYIGLFQLSNYEFKQYGSGNITDPRDNAIAGAYKFATEALLFEFGTGRKPTFSDLYLIHQQGWQGAAEHLSHPKRIAWRSMCATDEGKEKGERWCKRAIWGNTLPAIKQIWKSVDKLTSGAFVGMWQQRVADLYSQYSVAITKN